MIPVSAWGRLEAPLHRLEALTDARAPLPARGLPGLPRGAGRSYGDVCLNPGGSLWLTTELDHFIAFDEASGRLVCEAGVLLRDIQQLAVPRGWMLPVTPGTWFVTVGGAIANDVHGKNHHRMGVFGEHVRRIRLARTDGERFDCGPQVKPDWFAATLGGLGLTGLIVEAELQLRPVPGPWLDTQTIPYAGLDAFFRLSDESEADWEYTVAWIDCLSSRRKGVFMRSNHVEAHDGPLPAAGRLSVPFVPPVSLVNGLTLRPLNMACYAAQSSRAGRSLSHYRPFFYPLDGVGNWNAMYGPKGFFQYQSVVPRADGEAVTAAMLDAIARSGEGSFLAVLKTFGDRPSPGLLSFPQPGVTLALDFPNRGAPTLALFRRLDAIVREAGGRLYPAKDARMPPDLFEAGYPRLREFSSYRDPGISSGFSRRVMGS